MYNLKVLNLIFYLLLISLLLIFLIFMSIYGFSLIVSSMFGAPYVPTKNRLAEEILQEVKFKKNGLFVELGSGDGRIIRTAVKKYQLRGLAVDINTLLIIWSRFLARLDRIDKRISFANKNILSVDLSGTDYLYLFLFPELIDKLIPNFKKQLKRGTIIISHGFPVKGYEKKLFKKVPRNTFPTYYYRI